MRVIFTDVVFNENHLEIRIIRASKITAHPLNAFKKRKKNNPCTNDPRTIKSF